MGLFHAHTSTLQINYQLIYTSHKKAIFIACTKPFIDPSKYKLSKS